MYVVDQDREEHFSEGEPDLEPPEELAVGELDDDLLLEGDLESEAVLEEDVDEDVLEATLDDLTHQADDDDPDPDEEPMGSAQDLEELEVEALDIADVEESLDRILRERLAVEDELQDEPDDESGADERGARNADGVGGAAVATSHGVLVEEVVVAPCRDGEFVCLGCFLVRSRAQLADPAASLCRDCAS